MVFSQKPTQETGQGFIGIEEAHYIDRWEGGGVPAARRVLSMASTDDNVAASREREVDDEDLIDSSPNLW